MKKLLFFAGLSLLLISCKPAVTENTTVSEVTKEFWSRLQSLQGKTFEDRLADTTANDDFSGKNLVMHVLYSDDETILIPFNVGDNLSRTWIFKLKEGRIELKHDHRMESGESDETTMYGGTATNEGKADMQVFPADQETVDMLPGAFSNIWWITVDSTTFTYNLRRVGTDRLFTVIFDLTKEIEKPAPSWGWENFSK
jgi:hypothetical protein